MKMKSGNATTTGINTIRSNEINQENQLKNQEVAMNIPINARNTQSINQYGMANVQRRLGINSAVNANMNNLSRDFVDIQDKKNFGILDDKRMGITLTSDTQGVNSELIKNGDWDSQIQNPNTFNRLVGRNREAAIARLAILNNKQNDQ